MQSFVQRASAWLHSSDTGLSSEAIFHYMSLGVTGGSAPSDPADLARCLRLLDRFPEWKPRMAEMAATSDEWARIMPEWDAIVAMFVSEVEPGGYKYGRSWSAPLTYDLMLECRYPTRRAAMEGN